MITDRDDFVKYVLSVHYKEAKFSSFQRKVRVLVFILSPCDISNLILISWYSLQLYRWGFAKEDKGSSGRFDFVYFHKVSRGMCFNLLLSYNNCVVPLADLRVLPFLEVLSKREYKSVHADALLLRQQGKG